MTKLTTHTPPKEVQDTAKKGLELAQKTGLVSSTHIRAIGQALANGEPHTKERLRHIASFLLAHQKDATVRGWGSEESPSPAWLAWMMHGGEAGQRWVNDKVSKKVDMAGVPEGHVYRDFLDEVPTSAGPVSQAGNPRSITQEELSDLEYKAILNRSDPRILVERGGVLPPNPLAPKEPPTPGSEAEYQSLLDRLDSRINMSKRR